MRRWTLSLDEPLSLRIAADARWTQVLPGDDQIWELAPGEDQPRALSLRTTYGRRARLMHIFPGFRMGDQVLLDPDKFARPPQVHVLLPDYIEWSAEPFDGMKVVGEIWASSCQVLEGAFTLLNGSEGAIECGLRLHAVLQLHDGGSSMLEREMAGVTVLAGRAGDLMPVVFLGGGCIAAPAPYPALDVRAHLQAGTSRTWRWVHCGGTDEPRSFEVCRERLQAAWEPQVARLKMRNSLLVDINTGDERRDVVLWLAQRDTLQCLASPTRLVRNLWARPRRTIMDGQAEQRRARPLESPGDGRLQVYAALQLLPGHPDIARGLFENLIARAGRGSISDSGVEPTMPPLLCYLARRIYDRTADIQFLRTHIPALRDILMGWFTARHDRDGDGIPEWDHVIQAGFEDWPTFSPFHAWAQSFELSRAETIDLAAALYRECVDLLSMAKIVGETDRVKEIEARAQGLRKMVEASWSPRKACFQHRDRDLHITPRGGLLARGRGSFSKQVGRTFEVPVRAVVRVLGPEGPPPNFHVRVGSKGLRGRSRIERFSRRHFRWFWGVGSLTSEKPSKAIETIEVEGLPPEFGVELHAGDLEREDITTLLPLWAGMLDDQRAETLIRKTLLDEKRYWRSSGIASCSARDKAFSPDGEGGCGAVDMFWNTLLGEGLLSHGARERAADLCTRLLQAGMGSLQSRRGFCARYHADRPIGLGEPGVLAGSPPVKLFLDALGVQWIGPRKLYLRPGNPFPWPVRLSWRGLEVNCEGEAARVRFPDGGEIEVRGDEVRLIEQVDETGLL